MKDQKNWVGEKHSHYLCFYAKKDLGLQDCSAGKGLKELATKPQELSTIPDLLRLSSDLNVSMM